MDMIIYITATAASVSVTTTATAACTFRGSRQCSREKTTVTALLVEVGAAGNTLTEALRAIPVLAQAIIALKNGANWT
jgi:hypothetical protein